MRSYKKIMPIFLILIMFASVVFNLNNKREISESYRTALTAARDLAEKEIYTDAIEQYKIAIATNPSASLSYEAGMVYVTAADFYSAQRWYKDMVSDYPTESLTYLYGIQANYLSERYAKAFEVYAAYQDRGLYSEDVEAYVDQFRYMYQLTGKFEDWKPFSNVTDMAAVKYHDKWGYIADSGDKVIGYLFEDAGLFSELAPVIGSDGHAFYIDAKGNEKINGRFLEESDPSFGSVVKFGPYQGEALWAFNGKVWNAYRMDTYEKIAGGFQHALPFSENHLGAVSDGCKWALISDDGSMLTDYVYDEILVDAKETVCRTSALIVRVGKDYMLVDRSGDTLTGKTFTKAKAFCDNTYAAVIYNGKWCFADETGEIVLETDYEDAESFCNGFAAVKQNGKWGYIDMDGNLCISCVFDGAGQFNNSGKAFVKIEDYGWRLLSLYLLK